MVRFHGPLGVLALLTCIAVARAAEPASAERGRKALCERVFTGALWKVEGYDNAWKTWGAGLNEAPRDYRKVFMDHYGLHPAPFDNGRYPMGLRETKGGKGFTSDCMLCHAGSILGKSYVGLPNSSFDIQALFEDLSKASGSSGKTPFPFSYARGTSEAGNMAVYLLSHREPDLNLRLLAYDLDMHHHLCEDVPAWWLLKKKKTMYSTGGANARSVRSIMQFMLHPVNSRATFEREESTFRDIQAYLLSLEPPRYPFAIDKDLASQGEKIFLKTCAKCHGTYGEKWTYPNKIVPLEVIGTDRTRLDGISAKFGAHYNKSWFAREKGLDGKGYEALAPEGYQAPPLDGIWATAPYLHNGSVPTVYNMLNSKTRPKIFTRSFRTGKDDYDPVKLGWKVKVLARAPDADLPAFERRKVYDTTQPGRGNQGHTFGDDLTDDERRAVIEYLKTL